MRFLIDQNLPPALADWLREAGEAAEHVREIGMARDTDLQLAAYARANGMIVITKDADFIGPDDPKVVWVRWGNVAKTALIRRWTLAWPDIRAALERGDRFVELASST